MDRTRHGQHWLTALPTPYTESLSRQEQPSSRHIAYKLVPMCRWDIAYTYIENIPDNVIHSGSSCNMGAAQQVVLWCLSLVSKTSLLNWVLWKNKRTYTLLSLPNHELALLPNRHMCVRVFAICRPWADVLQKCCRRHLEEGLQAAAPFTERQGSLNGRGTKAS